MATQDIARTLLSRAHSPDTTSRIHLEKIQTRPLHLKPTTTSPAQQTRRLARQNKASSNKAKRKAKPAPLSARQKRSLDLYSIPKSQQKYAIYKPLNKMWIGYIQEVLWDAGPMRQITTATAAKLCSADYHGAELEVVRSRCVGRVGVKGIVVKDRKHVLEVVTRGDKLKILPKEGTVFRFVVPRPSFKEEGDSEEKVEREEKDEKPDDSLVERDLVFELHGDQFQYRAADRANRKFKSHFLPDL